VPATKSQSNNLPRFVIYAISIVVDHSKRSQAYVFAREFIFGSNPTGLVTSTNGTQPAENPTLAQVALPAAPGVAYGSRTTSAVTSAPAASISAFYSAIGVQLLTGTGNIPARATSTPTMRSVEHRRSGRAGDVHAV
jgi:hypothetical protein